MSSAVVPMRRSHIKACEAIVAASEPWRTLKEGLDFASGLSRNGPRGRAYVCMVRGETAGFVLFDPGPVFARGGYLRALGVAPKFRKQGLGTKLLEFAERATVRSAPYFYLCVSSFNRRAQAFYRDRGYARVGKLPGLIKPGASEYIYWKRLRRA